MGSSTEGLLGISTPCAMKGMRFLQSFLLLFAHSASKSKIRSQTFLPLESFSTEY